MRWIVLILLFFGAILNFADKSIVGLAAVPIMNELDLSYTEWGLVGSSYYWLYPVTGIFGAAWADKIGAKRVLVGLMVIWSVLQFGVLAVTALPLLVVYRILLGTFEGPYSPIAYSHAHKWFPPKLRGFANSVIVSGGTVGAMIIAPVLVALITMFGWKIAFATLGLASLVWAIIFQFFTKESPVEAYKNVQKKKKEKLEKIKLKDFGKLLVSPSALFTTLAYFSTYILIVWFSVWLPIYLEEVIEMPSAQMGVVVMIIGIISVAIYMGVSVLSDRLFKKNNNWRISRVYVIGIAMIVGAVIMASLMIVQNPIWVIIAMSLGKGLTYSIIPIGPTIMINEMPERGGLMTSILTSSGNLAGIVGPMITGFIISLSGANKMLGYNYSVLFMAAIVFIFATLFLLFVRPGRVDNISSEAHSV
ncbi:MFS transporter [Lentibacillus sp. L22]|uniref:MFS transporter n=1 Tax=Lentibacillus TaxID=175304 RepID=UPI0022B1B987|nr:MFS transporter [Lentibacillus daqui]